MNTSPLRECKYTQTKMLHLQIDISKPLESIMAEFENIVMSVKRYVSGEHDDIFSGMDEFLDGKVSDLEAIRRGGYTPKSDSSRAVGLWLWDRVKELGNKRGAVKQSLKEFHETGYLEKLGLEDVEEADLRFWYRRTDDCIKAAEVLPFTKRKKGTKES